MLYLYCALTVVLELIVFAIAGYGRRRYFVVLCIAANVATNLALNVALWFCRSAGFILFLESLAVFAEYAVYAAAEGRSRRLFLLTLGANVFSFTTGIIVFGL